MHTTILFAWLTHIFLVEASLDVGEVDKHHHHKHHHKSSAIEKSAVDPSDVETHARNAREAADSAVNAANVANQVAVHSIDITSHAQSALKHARNALHGARVDTSGLSGDQKEALRKAEEKLKSATRQADYGSLDSRKLTREHEGSASLRGTSDTDTERLDGKLGKLQDKLDQKDASGTDVSTLRSELRTLREKLAAKREAEGKGAVDSGGTVTVEDDVSAEEMERQLRDLERQVNAGTFDGKSADEVKAEMEHLRGGIDRLKAKETQEGQQLAKTADAQHAVTGADSAELRRLKARLAKYEKLKAGRAKEREVQEMLDKLRALKAAGKPIPAGAPTEAELEEYLRRLRAEDAALEKELGIAPGAEIDTEMGSIRKRVGTEEYGAEYGSLSLDVGRKQDSKGSREGGEASVDLDAGVDSTSTGGSESKTLPGDSVTMGKGAFDIDTEMPYGELEPFGREDTAQELTESSIKESDEMVDQLERAEVAEEKRAVFRALTRLRGAAITSYDGVARSQTGNIDEYNKTHKWRKTHPLHHLADEESDISKWAFPDTADF